ncbi:PTPA-CTERM sorting domain-containing protein [Stenomitos frigidus]|uniref:PEP-CTERM sorting domain-containing protein n=1 Tax=Stenomitos frigidus ULC18 TaxID=2107698 RepID=A0A2T1ELP3_9CYAN|nr:PTPA-CTERM sorting domain-containing protein [Stenomitos frigidus]PSB33625.1 hypothetical protein C7B82_03840 [Stenomitos frigidus ULC18]
MITLTAPQQFTLGVLGVAVLSLSTGNAAQAAVLFNNGAPDLQVAVRSDFGFPVEAGDNFTFATSNAITNITWSGLYSSATAVSTAPSVDQFSVRIFEFLNGTPAIAPAFTFDNISVNRSVNPQNTFFFNYSFAPTQPLALKAGSYLLSIVNNTQADTNLDWFWATSQQDGNNLGRFQPGDAWFNDTNTAELAFALEGNNIPATPTPAPAPVPPKAVPTPALLPGLIGFGVTLWRKRRSASRA